MSWSDRRRRARDWLRGHRRGLLYLAVAVLAAAPAWIVEYPPLEDLPYHLSTIRILHSLNDPAFGLSEHYRLTLGRTQYLGYYLMASALAYPLGVFRANVVLMSAYFAGSVLGMRSLLRALGKDERLCLVLVPLLTNVLFLYGLLPFLLGIPMMIGGIGLAIGYFERPRVKAGIALGALAVVLLYTHPLPFFLFGLGAVFLFPWQSPRRYPRAGAPLAPALAASLWWLLATPAGKNAGSAVGRSGHPKLAASLRGFDDWLLDIFADSTDEYVLVALMGFVILLLALARRDDEGGGRGRLWRYAGVPLACLAGYFFLARGYGFIWPLGPRFAVLFAILAVPLLSMPKGRVGVVATVAALALGAASTANVVEHFVRFQRTEVGDFEAALAEMAPGHKVCALIYDRGSPLTHVQPFLHFGSYYQARKGGVVQFSFAGYPHWPVDYREGRYPPPGEPARKRWEWTPRQVKLREIHPYYDYVLTRGRGFRPPRTKYRKKKVSGRWTVWERVEGGTASR